MAALPYMLAVRDSTSSPSGLRVTGLTLTWVQLKHLSDGTAVTPQPTFTELGQGQYMFSYDAEANGEAAGQVDCSVTLSAPGDRYIDVVLSRDSSRIQSGISATGLTKLDLTQTVPTANTAQTTGDALNAARVQAFGKWTLSGTALTLYNSDLTIARTFTLDSATAPTVRS